MLHGSVTPLVSDLNNSWMMDEVCTVIVHPIGREGVSEILNSGDRRLRLSSL